MKVNEVMNHGCQFLSSSDFVSQAAQIMANHDLGVVPIAEDNKLVGILTDRDIVVRGLAQGKNLATAPVSELMTDSVYYCFDDQSCEEVAQNMGQMQVRRMPVVDRDKQLVGVVSLGDLSRAAPENMVAQAVKGVSAPA